MFSIGSKRWPGISKLIEECGEVIQVAGKLMGARGSIAHFDGSNLKERLEDEIGDALAACRFVVKRCGLDLARVMSRCETKLALFEHWHETEADPPECMAGGRHGEYEYCTVCDSRR
jgi:NTP pyrophosphatase (non-canonical NTP hydrolase)